MLKVIENAVFKKTLILTSTFTIATSSLALLPQKTHASSSSVALPAYTTVALPVVYPTGASPVAYTTVANPAIYYGQLAPGIEGPIISPDGKVTWTVKAVKEVLRLSAAKIDKALDVAIDAIPLLSADQKKTWKATIKVAGLLKALDVIIDYSGTAEDIISKGIQYLGVPAWIADIIARTISAIFF
ncbi:hypothetical protein ACFCP7_27640 [Paenibacillus elgii]